MEKTREWVGYLNIAFKRGKFRCPTHPHHPSANPRFSQPTIPRGSAGFLVFPSPNFSNTVKLVLYPVKGKATVGITREG